MRYLVLCVLLAGCMSPEQREQQVINQCQHLGFQYNTPEFSQCRLQIGLAREQMEQQSLQSSLDTSAATLNNIPSMYHPSAKCYDTNIGVQCW